MPLTIGYRLGNYEITGPLGKGGMGEVYRAKDVKLGREVAIKMLPAAFAQHPERLARFEREAKVLASLNHPNIATIYAVEESPEGKALVMELVPGHTLKGPVELDEALKYATQIASALEAAHEKGITHRDLKPANIMLTPDGVIKVLDFGLAAVTQPTADPEEGSQAATLTMSPTQAGSILGTAPYMSPEQASGKPVDRRSDIWAFGVVLWEVLTGKRLFGGDTIAHTLAAVLKDEPDWTLVPVRVRRLLQACLTKDVKHRLQSIADWKYLLAEESGTASPAQATSLPYIVAAALGLIAVVALAAWWRTPQPEARPTVRLTVDLGTDVDLGEVRMQKIAISPDGTRIAYLASVAGGPSQIYTRRLDQPSATALRGTEATAEVRLAFSPDSQWIVFTQRDQIMKISVEGGAPIPLKKEPANIVGVDWEGGSIFFSTTVPMSLQSVSDDGKQPTTLLLAGKEELGTVFPDVLPGGKAVLFTAPTQLGENAGDLASIAVYSLADKVRKTLVRGGLNARYTSSGHLVYVNRGTLYAVPFDADKLETRGSPVPVLTDLTYHAATGEHGFSLSANGTLIYRSGGVSGEQAPLGTVHWLDRTGRRQPLIETPGSYRDLRLSPDALRLAVIVVPSLNSRVSVYDIQRGSMARISVEDQIYATPVWSPNGRHLMWRTVRGAQWARADGSGQPGEMLEVYAPSSFSPDGSRLLFDSGSNASDIRSVPIQDEGGQLKIGKPEPFLATPAIERGARFSPDGQWLAYTSNESGRTEVNVRAFPAPASGEGAKFTVSTDGGVNPVWSRSGSELYYQSGDRILASTYKIDGDKFVSTPPRVWAELKGSTFWDMAPDSRAVITAPVETGKPSAREPQHTIVYIENFFEELRRKVPLN